MKPFAQRTSSIRKDRWAFAAAIGLLLLNVYICRELFSLEFIRNLDSNEGVFVALSRFFRENFGDQRWFPRFNGGVPIENAYQPLLPVLAAAAGWLSGWSVERAFHFVLALVYCLGPVTLFWFAWEWSTSLTLSLGSGLAYSLTSFAELLIPILRVDAAGHWTPLRLYNLIHYAEDPHNLALTLLPVALLFLKRAITRQSAFHFAAAAVSCAAVVLANAFGAVDLAVGGICTVLALRRGWGILPAVGLAAYLLIAPWLPPSLIGRIAGDQWTARGSFHAGWTTPLALAILCAVFAGLGWISRNWRPAERFAVLFAPWMCAFPLAFFLFNVTLVPQGNRYQLELEMAMCLLFACLCARALHRVAIPWRVILLVGLALFGVRQTKHFRHAARGLLQPIEITQTIEYKIVHWLDRNLPRQRAMVSGDTQFLFNVLSDNPQLGGGHEPTVPNWMNRVAVYTIYSGDGAGNKDADYSIFWLKAFGTSAITISGEKSREHYHATAHPHKFDGILPVLWHEEDDTIFAVPLRSKSLAHVIPKDAVTMRTPVHGLDIEPARAYVAALDDPQLPEAELRWNGNSRFSARAPLRHGQVLSVQVNALPGWSATVAGRPVPLRADGLGLMVAEPDCDGVCTVNFAYGATAEAWTWRVLSAFAAFGLAALLFRSYFSRRARYFLNNS